MMTTAINERFDYIYRLTTMISFLGGGMFALWLIMLAISHEAFSYYTLLQYSWVGAFMLFAWVWALMINIGFGIGVGCVERKIITQKTLQQRWFYGVVTLSFVLSLVLWFNVLGL